MPSVDNTTRPLMPADDRGHPIPALALGVCQVVPFTATAGNSTAIGMNGFFITLDQPGHIAVGPSATATTGSHYIPAHQLLFFACDPEDRVSVRQQGATGGNAYISQPKKN